MSEKHWEFLNNLEDVELSSDFDSIFWGKIRSLESKRILWKILYVRYAPVLASVLLGFIIGFGISGRAHNNKSKIPYLAYFNDYPQNSLGEVYKRLSR